VASAKPSLFVLAGTNGAGKSSVIGAAVRESGLVFFNPDAIARKLADANPGLSQEEANGLAWREGLRLLDEHVAARRNHAFETTLGGATIAERLLDAAGKGFDVLVWYVGLASPELHLERIRRRVAEGGHDIPERDVRRRFDASRENLIRLMPALAALWVYDNSASVDFGHEAPALKLLLQVERGRIEAPREVIRTPDWAKPIVMAAMRRRPSGVPMPRGGSAGKTR